MNKKIAIDAAEDDTQEEPEELSDPLLDLIRSEREEKARSLIERGDYGYHPSKSFPTLRGDGEYASIVRATLGQTEEIHTSHLQSMRRASEARYPEIYTTKRGARSKQDRQLPSAPGGTKSAPTHITKEQFIDLYSAVSFANGFGVAMNVHIIIQWGYLGYEDHHEAARALQDGFFKPLHGWYAYNNGARRDKYGIKIQHELFWIYSHECSRSGAFHTHILAAIPLEMRKEFRSWVNDRVAALSKTQPPRKGIVRVVSPPSNPIGRQWIFFHYLCKGLDPQASVSIPGYEEPVPLADLIQFHYRSPGHIDCKQQTGMSRNLSRTARKKHEAKSFMEYELFDKRVLYGSIAYDAWHKENPGNQGGLELLIL